MEERSQLELTMNLQVRPEVPAQGCMLRQAEPDQPLQALQKAQKDLDLHVHEGRDAHIQVSLLLLLLLLTRARCGV